MKATIEIKGVEEFLDFTSDLSLSEYDEKQILKKAVVPIVKGLEKDTPKGRTKRLSKIKSVIKREDLGTVAIVSLGSWWDKFQEWGTSQQKKNVGFFERSTNKMLKEALEIIRRETLDRGI